MKSQRWIESVIYRNSATVIPFPLSLGESVSVERMLEFLRSLRFQLIYFALAS